MKSIKGKTYEQIYGKKKAFELCSIRSKDAIKQMKSQRKDKTLEQIYGIEKARIIKEKHTISLLGKNNPNFKGGMVKNNCIFCGKEFLTIPCRVGKAKYCSIDCKDKNQLKRRIVNCYVCNKFFSKKLSEIGYTNHNFCSKKCFFKFNHGKNNSAYKDGKSYEPYTSEFNETLKNKIRQRDNYTCQLCGVTEEEYIIINGKILGVHHIDYDKQNCGEDNLITLCHQCNSRVNFNRAYWQNYFEIKVVKKELNA